MKTVKLLKDRGGDKAGGRITVPDSVADNLVHDGIAAFDSESAAKPKVEPVAAVAPAVPKARFDALTEDFIGLQESFAELKAKYDDLAKSAAELDKDNAELSKDNKALRDQLAAHPLEPVKKK